MRKSLMVLLLVLAMCASVITGCTEPAPTAPEPTTPEPTTPATPQPSGETIEIKFSQTDPPTHFSQPILEEWAQKVEQQTEGKVHITI